MTFTEAELGVISNALRVAAERFHENASEIQRNYGNSLSEGFKRLAEQFGRQEHEARKVYERLATETGIAS